ncbi:hypothetical protein TPE_1982 [Treponema pedis str. T A4]|uniref:Transposase n=1 Tax=Treponema pedis str. T A4 TaxID=1291379 RepID=S6A4I1_9SPIR|nr:hypothetical protein TPE_1982 [Treponema pedis str. T A4]
MYHKSEDKAISFHKSKKMLKYLRFAVNIANLLLTVIKKNTEKGFG